MDSAHNGRWFDRWISGYHRNLGVRFLRECGWHLLTGHQINERIDVVHGKRTR
jgi:hypothetical protein